VLKAREAERGFYGILTEAVAAMRAVMFESGPEIAGRGMNLSFPGFCEDAAVNLSGWARPQIKMFPSVRQALGEEGEPRTVLRKRLPEYALQAHSAGAREPSELLEHIRRLFNQTRRTQPKRSLHNASESMLEGREAYRNRKQNAPSALEEWYAKQEALQRLDALIPRAGLSPREAEFLSLSRSGLSYSAIASHKGVKVGTVKTVMFRAKAKLSKATNS
jgi:DNA-directed RNA polymerase specialized sigma24 family protein